jgi:hypothetical protein
MNTIRIVLFVVNTGRNAEGGKEKQRGEEGVL